MKILSRWKWICLLGLVYIMSCKKFVQIGPPNTLLATSSVFDDNGTATSAQVSIYIQMSNNPDSYNLALQSGLLSDELVGYSSTVQQFYKNGMTALKTNGLWTHAYSYIYQANAIIEGVQASQRLNNAVKQQLIGESKFIRSFWHFYLVNSYGDVPLTTTTNYSLNGLLPRTPKESVCQQITSDLAEAKSLLSSKYIDFTDTSVTDERTRPTKWAAEALLAKVYLYLGKYDSAEANSADVIDHTELYEIESDLNNVFVANSKEVIWQLQNPQPGSGVTWDGYFFILNRAPGGSLVSVSKQLLDSFETGDRRRNNWIHDTIFAGQQYAYPYKYQTNYLSSDRTEYLMVLRLAEQYLIRAEARAKLGKSGGAMDDLNVVRRRAGLPDYSGAGNTDSLINAILHERKVELFTEWGNRWFDLKRTGRVNAVMSIVTPSKGGVWNPDGHQQLYPIPQSEINKDVNLKQNPGY